MLVQCAEQAGLVAFPGGLKLLVRSAYQASTHCTPAEEWSIPPGLLLVAAVNVQLAMSGCRGESGSDQGTSAQLMLLHGCKTS